MFRTGKITIKYWSDGNYVKLLVYSNSIATITTIDGEIIHSERKHLETIQQFDVYMISIEIIQKVTNFFINRNNQKPC